MASSVESLIERVMGELHRIVQTQTVVGEPVQAGSVTLVPVSKISFGFGAGGGQEGKGQSGTGGGATVEPIAFVVINADGNAQLLTFKEDSIKWSQLMELVPGALGKIKSFVSKEKNPSEPQTEDRDEDEETTP
jgi:uncharacterized spore protein YtfJ